MSTEFLITVRATSILIQPGEEAIDYIETLIDLMTYEDEFEEQTKVLGFIYEQETDTLYLHKGVDLNYLRKLLPKYKIVEEPFHKFKHLRFEYEEIVPPRNEQQVDVINFIAGLNYHSANLNERQLFLIKNPGFGKAEPYSRKIPTPTELGCTLMGDLKVGDYVFDRRGKATKIIDIFEQGEQDVYEITFNDGRTAQCTENHLWLTMNKYGDETVKELKDMINDYKTFSLCRSKIKNCDPYKYNYRIPTCQPVKYTSRDVPIDPWVLGCFIGNGCLRERVLTISSGSSEIPEKIASICGINYTKNSSHNYSYSFRYDDGHPILTRDFFKEVPDLINSFSYEKYIPNCYIHNDPSVRLGILQGLMDTDGSISERGKRFQVMFSTTSDELAKQIQYIAYSLGFSVNIFIDKRARYTKGHCNILTFRIPNSYKHKLFKTSRKHNIALKCKNIPQQRSFDKLIIKDIRKLGYKERCRCIKVDNDEHLYLTENFIVTHNTYCSGVGLCKFGAKTLIITHRDNIRSQWLKSLQQMSGLGDTYIHVISSTDEVVKIARNEIEYEHDYDVFLITHATFRAGIKYLTSMKEIGNITKNLGIGMKIIDEAHLEFKDTLMMDFCFNVKRNLYLTATGGRSQKEENSIFHHVFSNALYYKPSALLLDGVPKKWVDYTTVCVNSNVKPSVYRYRVAGGRGMNPATYGKWVIQIDKNKTHFKCCRDLLKMIYDADENAKVLVFMPLIDLCGDAAYFFNKELNYDPSFKYDLNIKTINSRNSARENYENRRADVIVTTIQSCGTGTDIPGITAIISCSPFVSKITAEQVFGRIRYCGKKCYYYDIYDLSVQMDKFWLRSRRKKFKQLALNVRDISWSDDSKKE